MKEIKIAKIVITFVGLLLLGLTLFVCTYKPSSRIEDEQVAADYQDLCIFIMPDGSVYIPAEVFEAEVH